jgi:predicted chitinase
MFVNPDPRNKQQEALAAQNREKIETDSILAAQVTLWFWTTRVRPYVQNFMDTRAVTRRINPAGKGLQDRQDNFQDYMQNI